MKMGIGTILQSERSKILYLIMEDNGCVWILKNLSSNDRVVMPKGTRGFIAIG